MSYQASNEYFSSLINGTSICNSESHTSIYLSSFISFAAPPPISVCTLCVPLSLCQVAHMTKSELYLPDTAFIGPGLLFLNQYFNSFIDEHIVLWIAMVSSHPRFVFTIL